MSNRVAWGIVIAVVALIIIFIVASKISFNISHARMESIVETLVEINESSDTITRGVKNGAFTIEEGLDKLDELELEVQRLESRVNNSNFEESQMAVLGANFELTKLKIEINRRRVANTLLT